MRERGAALALLVDDHDDVGAARVRAHPLAPGVHRDGDLLDGKLRERERLLGPVDDDLVRADGWPCGEQLGSAAPGLLARAAGAVLTLAGGERGIEVLDDAHGPAGGVRVP